MHIYPFSLFLYGCTLGKVPNSLESKFLSVSCDMAQHCGKEKLDKGRFMDMVFCWQIMKA